MWWELLRSTLFKTFIPMLYSRVDYSHIIHYIPSTYFSCYWIFVLMTTLLQFLSLQFLSLVTANLFSFSVSLMDLVFFAFRFYINVRSWSDSPCLSVSDFMTKLIFELEDLIVQNVSLPSLIYKFKSNAIQTHGRISFRA